jgi:D-3-phosphoglycerate dehydrogenase / 2-oxoglutarate reductase
VAKVLVTDHPFPDFEPERRVLEPLGVELILAPDAAEGTLADAVPGADALLVCYAEITDEVIAAAQPSCRVIARYGVGFDNIDIEAASNAGVLVTYVPDYCLDEVADHTMSLLLAAARAVTFASREVEEGHWALPEAPVRRLRGQRLALVGVGRIGRRVAERARSFGLEVVGFDPFLQDWDGIGVKRADTLEEALVDADAISLHAPLTPENRHLISDRTLTGLNRRPILVNTSRGGLVDLQAAVRALEDGRLSAVALDVTEPEPLPPGHPLRRHPRAIVTPHMAYYSVEAQEDLQTRAAEEVARALRGEPPRCPVNPDVLAAPSR